MAVDSDNAAAGFSDDEIRSGEIGRVPGARPQSDVVGFPDLGDDAIFDHMDFIRQKESFRRVVGDEQPGTGKVCEVIIQ